MARLLVLLREEKNRGGAICDLPMMAALQFGGARRPSGSAFQEWVRWRVSPPLRQPSTRSAVSGALSRILSNALAAPVGPRLPCSQLRMVS